VDAEPLTLSPSQITPLGLCLGEVLTNAFKHAFPESGAGELFVGAHRAGDQIEVTVQDNGKGYDGARLEPVRSA
jgi:two-component sensor histidine kinase